MHITPGSIVAEPDEHLILVGPLAGTVTTLDGTTFDVSAAAVVIPEDKVAEVANLIGLRYAAEGHRDHDAAHPFTYEPPKKFAKYVPHPANATLKGK